MTPPPGLASAPVPSLGVVLVGCLDCRALLGLAGAPGLAAYVAAHRRGCAKRPRGPRPAPPRRRRAPAMRPLDEVCPRCGCEAELYPRDGGWRCADCLGELLSDILTAPPTLARPRVRAASALRHGERQDDAAQSERAVA